MLHTTSAPSGSSAAAPTDKLSLPFILINAPRDCRVHCEMLEDRSQYFFEFDSPFLINEDIELLRLMGLDRAREADLQNWLPADAIAFLRDDTPPAIDMGALGLDEWDAAHVDSFLESMPPAVGGLVGLDICDFSLQPVALTSPIKPAAASRTRPLRPFRQATAGRK